MSRADDMLLMAMDRGYTPEQIAQQCIATLCDGVLRRVEAPASVAPKAPRRSRRSSNAMAPES